MTYLDLYLDYPYPMSLLLVWILGLMRFAPIVVLAPFYGAKLLPAPVKMAIVASLAVTFLPLNLAQVKEPLQFDMAYLGLALKELFIGVLLGTFISMPFFIANSSGVLIDHQRGTSTLMQLDPTMGNQASPLGLLYNYMLIYLFFQIDGPWFFLDSVSLSYSIVPPNQFLSSELFASSTLPLWHTFINLANVIMTVATQLAAPALVAMFMTDLFLGIANRLAPQVPMSFLGWSLKSLFGVGILYLGWFFILRQLQMQTIEWLELTRRLAQDLA